MKPLIRAVRPYASRIEFVRDAAQLVCKGGPVAGEAPKYGVDPDLDVLPWPAEVRACPMCRRDCKGLSLRRAREAIDDGHRVELVLTKTNPAHMAVRIDGVLIDPSEEAGAGHAPESIWAEALIVGVR
ncbi:MAG: hypothetical protein IPN58_17505 [Anaerolineales bacterium]|nr:hypothetical protein [Sandaracinaceae bacterium]MBK8824334.1 hypothetical protein [Anaerolineales bacterium]